MLRKSVAFALVAALATVLAATALARRDSTPKLTGSDGPGFTINLKSNGKAVKSLKAGSYKLVISDRSSIHGWALDGPNKFEKDVASVGGTSTKTVTLKFKAGKYKFYCPAHESIMFGRFTVK